LSRSVYILAASALALSACQPADEPTTTLEADAPPTIADTVEVSSAPVAAEQDHDEHDDAEHDDHDDDEHDAHDDHGDEHEDDHGDDEDHAGGEAHVHGVSDLAASLDGAVLSISIEGALANFDLDESLRTLEDQTPYTNGIVEIIGGDCSRDKASASIRPVGEHGNMSIDLTYTCASADQITALDIIGFQNFSGFEEVNAVFLTDANQIAETLTETDTRLDIS